VFIILTFICPILKLIIYVFMGLYRLLH